MLIIGAPTTAILISRAFKRYCMPATWYGFIVCICAGVAFAPFIEGASLVFAYALSWIYKVVLAWF